ncbi:MAG: hypothetical protein WCZ72_10975 [Gemmobacter sp.]
MNLTTTQFAPARKPTRAEITDRAAREIITAQRDAQRRQIARLRAARLKREAADRSAQKVNAASPQRKKAR